MASKKADYESLMVQEFLSFEQAMAYCNLTADEMKELVLPYVHTYRSKFKKGDYFLPEIRKRKLQLVEMEPQYTT
jgi:hypothetical protein